MAAHPKDATKFMGEVIQNMPLAKKRFLAAHKLLSQHARVDSKKIAAMGYCFGGSIVLNMARLGVDLDGVASFHGGLDTKNPAQKGKVKAKVLVLHGADDKLIKPEAVPAFKKEMKDAGVDLKFIAYKGAQHSFTNPGADAFGKKFGIPLAYDKKADQQSWAELSGFLKRIFK